MGTVREDMPRYSPWGKVDHCNVLCAGVFSVSTPSHGGIMTDPAIAMRVFSGKALEFCFREGGYVCFEEDCAATVALRELMDRGLYQAPVNEYWKPGEYGAVIDSSIQRWYPDYWAAREAGQTHQTAAQEKRAKERER